MLRRTRRSTRNRGFRRRNSGWFRAPREHALAAYGISPRNVSFSGSSSNRSIIVVDLDGTIFNASMREKQAIMASQGDPDKFWAKFFNPKAVKLDRPIKGTPEFLTKLSKKYDIVYLTGRPDRLSKESKKKLKESGYPTGKYIFRPESEPTLDFKRDTIAGIKEKRDIALIIGDDRVDVRSAKQAGVQPRKIIKVRSNQPWNEHLVERRLEGQ